MESYQDVELVVCVISVVESFGFKNLVGERLVDGQSSLRSNQSIRHSHQEDSASAGWNHQLYLLGIWDSANNSLVGQHDPGRIFRNVPQPQQNSASRYQINMLIGALSLLLHGCLSDVPSGAMDSNFQGSTMQATIGHQLDHLADFVHGVLMDAQ